MSRTRAASASKTAPLSRAARDHSSIAVSAPGASRSSARRSRTVASTARGQRDLPGGVTGRPEPGVRSTGAPATATAARPAVQPGRGLGQHRVGPLPVRPLVMRVQRQAGGSPSGRSPTGAAAIRRRGSPATWTSSAPGRRPCRSGRTRGRRPARRPRRPARPARATRSSRGAGTPGRCRPPARRTYGPRYRAAMAAHSTCHPGPPAPRTVAPEARLPRTLGPPDERVQWVFLA